DYGLSAADIADLLDSWATHLKSEHKSPHTIRAYRNAVDAYLRWCQLCNGITQFDRASVEAFTAYMLDQGEAGTALPRQTGIRRFAAGLAEDHEIERDERAAMNPPKPDEKIPAELTVDQVKALLGTCGIREFHDIRDAAIIRLMTESMVR